VSYGCASWHRACMCVFFLDISTLASIPDLSCASFCPPSLSRFLSPPLFFPLPLALFSHACARACEQASCVHACVGVSVYDHDRVCVLIFLFFHLSLARPLPVWFSLCLSLQLARSLPLFFCAGVRILSLVRARSLFLSLRQSLLCMTRVHAWYDSFICLTSCLHTFGML